MKPEIVVELKNVNEKLALANEKLDGLAHEQELTRKLLASVFGKIDTSLGSLNSHLNALNLLLSQLSKNLGEKRRGYPHAP